MVLRKLIILTFLIIGLSGCIVLPGMENPATGCVEKIPNTIRVRPTVIPITPDLIVNNPPPCYIYHISPQDVLSVVVWMHPEFNPPPESLATSGTPSSQAAGQTGYLVDHNGRIYFPLVGYLDVAGKTPDDVRVELTMRLRKYIRNPQVILRVADYRSKKVYLLGEVHSPGLYPLNDQIMSITDLLTLAGSFDPEAADTRHIYVIRGDFSCPQIFWLDAKTPTAFLLAQHFHLQPGDIIYVSSAMVTRWNRFLNQILPTLSTVFFVKSITGK